MEEIFDVLGCKHREYERLVSEFVGIAREEFAVVLQKETQEFFKQHPEIKAFGWSQYTDYFNDGEECYFRIYDLKFLHEKSYAQFLKYNKVEEGRTIESYMYDEEAYRDYWLEGSYDIRELKNKKTIGEFANKLYAGLKNQKEALQEIIGDHLIITIKSGGNITFLDYTSHN